MYEPATIPPGPTPTLDLYASTVTTVIYHTVTVTYTWTVYEPRFINMLPVAYAILACILVPTCMYVICPILFSILFEIIYVSTLLLNRLIRLIRVRTLPYIRTFLPHQPYPPSIATIDILLLVVAHLSRRDLVCCCRVSRLFLEVASTELYGSRGGLTGGRELYYSWQGGGGTVKGYTPLSVRLSPVLFKGVNRRTGYDVSDSIAPQFWLKVWGICFEAVEYPFFEPSKLKRELLHKVRHLTHGTHIFQDATYDRLSSRDMFPSLITLTLPSTNISGVQWELPLLANLRPRHIRLSLIHGLGSDPKHPTFHLGSELGSETKKVTLQFVDCALMAHSVTRAVSVGWPKSMDRLDLVFMGPSFSPSLPYHSFARAERLTIPDSDVRSVVLKIVAILASASAMTGGGRIRIIGLNEKSARQGSDGRAWVAGEAQDVRFADMLKEEYASSLRSTGMEREEAETQAGQLEFVRLEEYVGENDCPPF